MKVFVLTGILAVFVLCFICVGSAEQVEAANQTEYVWNGTWASENFTLFIAQNESGISGSYIPDDPELYDAGILEGTLSDNGNTLSGVWTESGLFSETLSSDGMSFNGTGSSNPQGNMDEASIYNNTGTRVGKLADSDNIWSGAWVTERKSYNYTQDGLSITGTNQPLPGIDDEPGSMVGTVSDDGKIITGKWVETGNFTFIISKDGSFFNGTYNVNLDLLNKTESWNATKIL